jgi:hypothetical protein
MLKARPVAKANAKNLTTDLNVVLSKDQINTILTGVLGQRGSRIGNRGGVMINEDHCCVDVSVGSSVVGPATSVGSAVSVPNLDTIGRGVGGLSTPRSARPSKASGDGANSIPINAKLDKSSVNVNIQVPKNLKVK